ncbi:MAG: SH3 domain-containing protein [Spirochaetales bacterium]|nr:SH3 domain-containing protein [Spirochaetales bacterium]
MSKKGPIGITPIGAAGLAAGVLLSLLAAGALEAQTLDLPLLGAVEANLYSSISFDEIGGKVYTDGIPDVRNQLLRLSLDPPELEGLVDIHRYHGSFAGELLVAIMGTDNRPRLFLMDPLSLKRRAAPNWGISIDWALVEAGEGSFYCARSLPSGRYEPYRFDVGARAVRAVDTAGVPIDLSGDGLHLLIQDPESGRVVFWNLFEDKPTGSVPSLAPPGQVRFVDNGYALLPPEDPKRPWSVVDVEGKEALSLSLSCGRFRPLSLWLSRDGRHGVAGYMSRLNPRAAVVDAAPLWQRLRAEGLVFTATSGTLNAGRVRIREHPSLKAKTLGHLEQGEKVRVLERSGYREPIDGMVAPWYRIETEDGRAGWSYGHFIDLR